MKKIYHFIIIITLSLLLLPVNSLAQLDFNDWLLDPSDGVSDVDIFLNDFELIWSTDTYVPYEYQGRTLSSKGGEITVEALIDISGGSIESLKYSWFLDDVFQEAKSGYGKNNFQFIVRKSGGATHEILLKVFNDSRSFYVEKSIEIPVVDPELIVYPSNGDSYFSDQASKISFVLAGKKFSFIAKPYFFSIKKLTDLNFEWRFTGQETISSAYNANVLNLTIPEKKDEEILSKDLWVGVYKKTGISQQASQIIKVQIY